MRSLDSRRTPQAVVIAGPNGAGKTSARSIERRLRGLQALGYEVHVFYLWLPTPELAVARVRIRVQAGGHDVPEHVIRRRFRRSLLNFDRIYRPLSSTWRLYDGSATEGRLLIAHGRGEGMTVVDKGRWSSVRVQIEEMRE